MGIPCARKTAAPLTESIRISPVQKFIEITRLIDYYLTLFDVLPSRHLGTLPEAFSVPQTFVPPRVRLSGTVEDLFDCGFIPWCRHSRRLLWLPSPRYQISTSLQ